MKCDLGHLQPILLRSDIILANFYQRIGHWWGGHVHISAKSREGRWEVKCVGVVKVRTLDWDCLGSCYLSNLGDFLVLSVLSLLFYIHENNGNIYLLGWLGGLKESTWRTMLGMEGVPHKSQYHCPSSSVPFSTILPQTWNEKYGPQTQGCDRCLWVLSSASHLA